MEIATDQGGAETMKLFAGHGLVSAWTLIGTTPPATSVRWVEDSEEGSRSGAKETSDTSYLTKGIQSTGRKTTGKYREGCMKKGESLISCGVGFRAGSRARFS